ncbi:MAG: hypothetical protein FWE32_10615 [Oscillospiraceae bacterium]|nr:hypothetical protein [Oscillospiraceae bacterium]
MSLPWGIFEFAILAIDVAYFTLILNYQLGLKHSNKKSTTYPCAFLIIFLIGFTFNYLNDNSASSLFLFGGLYAAYSALLTNGKWLFKAFWIGFPVLLMMCFELFATAILLAIHPEVSVADFSLLGTYRVQGAVISRVVQIFVLLVLLRNKLHLEQIGYVILLPLAIFPFLSAAGMIWLHADMLEGRVTNPTTPLLISLILLVFNLAVIWLVIIINQKSEMIKDHELQTQKQELKIKNYQQLMATHQKFKSYQEAVDEIMANLWKMLKDEYALMDRDMQISAHQMVLLQITQLRQSFNLAYCTGDEILDVVLSSRDNIVREKGIKLQVKFNLPETHDFNSSIIGGVLTHVLDNAIDTVDAVGNMDSEKIIELSIEVENEFCEIIAEYPADRLTELKTLLEHHSIALCIATGIVERFHGTLETICEDYYITTKVQLPIRELIAQPKTEAVLC